MNITNETYLIGKTGKIVKIYSNKKKLHLERAIQHDYFARDNLETNKGTKQ